MGNKTIFFFLLLGWILSACTPLDTPQTAGDKRRPQPDIPPVVPDTPEPPAPEPDTLLYYSTVRFPDGYDWQRDTAYGSVPFELILYRDHVPALTLAWDSEACFCPDPDRHHLLGGHLYTECMSGGHTRVGCDGQELFRFEGREFLVGLLPDGADLYTLSRKTSGTGFSYRKNGILLLESDSGTPFGDLSEPSFGPTGALYLDHGVPVFCYRDGTQLYLVRNGAKSLITDDPPGRQVLDCKVCEGEVRLLHTKFLSYYLLDGRLWRYHAGQVVTGKFHSGRGRGYSGWMDGLADTTPRQLCREEAQLYFTPEGIWAVATDAAGGVRWYGAEESGNAGEPARLFTPNCATVFDGQLILALTPLDMAQPLRILQGTQQREIYLNGYVSAVAVEVSPPAS